MTRRESGFGMASFSKLCLWPILFCWFSAQAQDPALLQETELKGVVIPVRSGHRPSFAAVIRAERVFIDYRRKGFFRIGMLPIVVAEGVSLEFLERTNGVQTLARTASALERRVGKCYELRNIRFQVDSTLRLQADRIRPKENGVWQFSGAVTLQSGTNQTRFSRGTLQTAGASAGLLSLSRGTESFDLTLFSSQPFALNPKTP